MSAYVLAHVALRISIVTILVSSRDSFDYPDSFFVYKYNTSDFVTGKCRLKVKRAGRTYQDGVNMAY